MSLFQLPQQLLPGTLRQGIKPAARNLLGPATLGKIAARLPFKINATLIESICNRAFKEQIEDEDFEFLAQRTIQIKLMDANLAIGLSYQSGRIVCLHFGADHCEAEATLSINSIDAISLIQQQVDPDTLFFQRKLKISGDTELAHHIKNTIDTLSPEIIPAFLMKFLSEYKSRVLSDASA